MEPVIVGNSSAYHQQEIPAHRSSLLDSVDFFRLRALQRLDPRRKAEMAQFFTPAPVAQLMASMFDCSGPSVRIVDAGAGVGILFAACVAELCNRENKPEYVGIAAYEIDQELLENLSDTLDLCRIECKRANIRFEGKIIQGDFIGHAVAMLHGDLFSPRSLPHFNCAILNPPFHKIHTDSEARKTLRRLGIETSNIYTGFLATVMQLLEPGGELVAISPRSFCNGRYFRTFRRSFLKTMTLRRFHLFESREEAFRDDDVLQETLVFHAVKEKGKSGKVAITSSAGPDDPMILSREMQYDQVVHPDDPETFIRIVPDDLGQQVTDRMALFQSSLPDLGISVSTGRVVDFRAAEFLRQDPETGTVPLIYPAHFDHGNISWPRPGAKKPNALLDTIQTQDLLVPNGTYVLVKRFSAKEEPRRVVAAIYDGRLSTETIGFENHLNYFHQNGRGLDVLVARGLAAYLNSTIVDQYFRQFNGHTQVNATDLRNMTYPDLSQIEALGSRIPAEFPTQEELDQLVEEEFAMVDIGGVDPVAAKRKLDEALKVLRDLGLPRAQQNERSALTLLALLDLRPEMPWSEASDPMYGITQIMSFFSKYYGKTYAPNTRETVRRQTVHQFLEAGLVIPNPDDPERPINSGKTVYQVEQGALELLRTVGTLEWERALRTYLMSVETLSARCAQERQMSRIPVSITPGKDIALSPGGQNVLVAKILEEFAPRFTPGAKVLYVGDTDEKFAYFDPQGLAQLGVEIEAHGKMPDVILHHMAKNWLVLVEAVTSHGPVDPKRRNELGRLFATSKASLVFVTAFLTRRAMVTCLTEVSWQTEVWVADAPTHLIHFDGERFLGPYQD